MAKLTLTRARQAELVTAAVNLKHYDEPEFKLWIKDLDFIGSFAEYARVAHIADAGPTPNLETLYEASIITEGGGEYTVFTFNPHVTLTALNKRQAQAHKECRPVNITFLTAADYGPTSPAGKAFRIKGLLALDASRIELVEFTGTVLEDVDLLASPVVSAYFESGTAALVESKREAGLERLLKAVEETPDEDEYEDEYEDDDDHATNTGDFEDEDSDDMDESYFNAPEVDIVPSKLVLTQARKDELLDMVESFKTDYNETPEYEAWLDDENYQGSFAEYVQGAHILNAAKETSCKCSLRRA